MQTEDYLQNNTSKNSIEGDAITLLEEDANKLEDDTVKLSGIDSCSENIPS